MRCRIIDSTLTNFMVSMPINQMGINATIQKIKENLQRKYKANISCSGIDSSKWIFSVKIHSMSNVGVDSIKSLISQDFNANVKFIDQNHLYLN